MNKLLKLRRPVFVDKVQELDPISQDIKVLAGSTPFGKKMSTLRFYAGIGEYVPYEIVIDGKTYPAERGEVSVLVERGSVVSFKAQAEGYITVSGSVEVQEVNAEIGLPRFVVAPMVPTPDPTPDPDPEPEPEPEPEPDVKYTVTVSVTPAAAIVVLGSESGVGSVSGEFAEGSTVVYSASLEGYASQLGSIVVSKDESVSLTLEASTSGTPEDVGSDAIAVSGSNTFEGKSVSISELPDLSSSTAKTTINAESITLTSGFTSPRVLSLVAVKDIAVEGSASAPLTIAGTQPKTQGNSSLSLNAGGAVVVKNVTFAKDDGAHNGLEIGLAAGGDPTSVVIENVNFEGALKNNAISIFGTASNATVYVKNCTFKSCSNAVRLSNKLASTGVSVIFENCALLECTETGAYRGFLLMEDHTSTTAAAAESRNVFGPDKLSVAFINCTIGSGSDAEVINFASAPAEGAPFADGVVNPKQAYYTFYDKGFGDLTGPIPYNAESYPVFSFK